MVDFDSVKDNIIKPEELQDNKALAYQIAKMLDVAFDTFDQISAECKTVRDNAIEAIKYGNITYDELNDSYIKKIDDKLLSVEDRIHEALEKKW